MFAANQLVHLLFIFLLVGFEFVQSTCSRACTSCTNDTCVACNLGNYLESGSCHTCPVNCTSCYNSGACYICVEGYFGLSCDKQCHEMCLNKACHKDSGICAFGCGKGYFDIGIMCVKCNVNCKTCTQTSINCLECKEGNYGPACQYPCSHCTDGICTRDNCTYGCVDGFFIGNETCISCSARCTSCSDTFDNCHSCVDGYFGPACTFLCSDCSACNKENGSCPTIKEVYPPTALTQMTTLSKESTISVLTTRMVTTTSTNTSKSATNTDSNIQKPNQEDPSPDNKTIISAASGGAGGLVVILIVVIIVIVCKRRGRAKQSDILAESIDMTENENYISAEGKKADTVPENIDMKENENYISAQELDENIRKSTNAQTEEHKKEMERNDYVYSQPIKTHRSTVATMEPISDERPDINRTLIPTKLPGKSNVYADLI